MPMMRDFILVGQRLSAADQLRGQSERPIIKERQGIAEM